MRYINVRPSQVNLDPDNPRLPDGTTSDREAINRLLDEGLESLINLARDLAQTGESNPAELPIAVKQGNKYLILEGNRRFAALKLLRDPALAYDNEHERAFRRAAALGTPPSAIYTLVCKSKEEADRWIVYRHTGENGGRGTKRWSAEQAATYRRRAKKVVDAGTDRSITIADELAEAYAADPEVVELVRRVRRDKLTNIGRFFSKDVLLTLHFTIETDKSSNIREKTLWVRHDAGQLRDFFMWSFGYILNHTVDAYKNPDIRKDLLISAGHVTPSNSDAADRPFRLATGPTSRPPTKASAAGAEHTAASHSGPGNQEDRQATEDSGSPQENTPSEGVDNSNAPETRARRRAEAKPDRFLLQGLRLPNHPRRVQDLIKECRTVDVELYPGVACVMARVIVELSVSSEEVLKLSGASEGEPLKDKIIKMLKYLDPDIEKRKRDQGLAQAFFEASEIGMQYLNGFVHNPNVRPDHHLARRYSDAFRPFLERVDEAL
ncbi:hypothetical protein [Micromonospora sp. M61]|uniref:hypothetical protein n=1 Tax=Micromonospora sp. M61 TaxID=2824890 RepID=UPI001B35F467|nr:hypothetical protein [Micromonospora sp. M61]MBQ0977566.1 hypothetical protein [Micromonospora sp. M61]